MDILILGREDVQRLLALDALIDGLAEGFKALSAGNVVAPRRSELSMADMGSVLTMPAWQSDANATIKMVSIFHANSQKGLPAHMALICLFAAQTGMPLALLDGNYITAMRTAGAAALSTRLLARKQASVLAILGAGVQGEAHARLLPHVRDFRDIRIASRTFAHAQRLAVTIDQARAVESFEEAVQGADVVCLCSSSSTPFIVADWLSPGTHVTSVGYNAAGGELGRDVIERGKLFVETRLAFESPPVGCGELAGLDPTLAAELGEVLLGRYPGRQTDKDITIYKAMGHAMEDLVAANLVYQQARQQGSGQLIAM